MKKTKKPPAPAGLTDAQVAARNAAALDRVEDMEEPEKLRALIANAARMGVLPVRDAAFRRLALIQTEGEPGTVEHDFWLTVHAFEEVLKEDRGKAVRMTPTRQKIARIGAVRTLADFVNAPSESRGFELLVERNLPDMTGEAVILRHPDDFDEATRDAANARLTAAGVDPATSAA